jgi:hypothetical protein
MYNPFSVITDILSSSDHSAANDAATAGDRAKLWISFSSITQLLSKQENNSLPYYPKLHYKQAVDLSRL